MNSVSCPKAALSLLTATVLSLAPTFLVAAPVSYMVDAVFEEDFVFELVGPSDNVCLKGDSCYPTGFRPPKIDGSGVFSDLIVGDAITSKFSFDPDTGKAADECEISGMTFCDTFFNSRDFSATSGAVRLNWSTVEAFDSSLVVDLINGSITYSGEAGSYFPGGCSLSAPNYEGLPSGFCDFFGYGATFRVTDFKAVGLASVPLPASLPMLLLSLAVFWRWRSKHAG